MGDLVNRPSFIFDLDGTLIDSVYQHVIAWRGALADEGIDLSVWRIHRRIGMSGGLFVRALAREIRREISPEQVASLQQSHARHYRAIIDQVRPLPGASELLAARRAGGLGIGLLSAGHGRDELERAHAFRVYEEPADRLVHIDELGVRPRP